MSAQNVISAAEVGRAEVVRRGYAAFNTGDMKTLTEIFDEGASWHTPGSSPAAGDRHGRDAVFARFGRYGGETGATFKAELDQVFASADGRVIGLHHHSGERDGKQLDTDCCIVFELENRRVTSGREHFYDLANWDALWFSRPVPHHPAGRCPRVRGPCGAGASPSSRDRRA